MGADEEPRVVHDERSRRYEVYVGDRRAGEASYEDEPGGRRVLLHTLVEPEYEGRGLAARLAKAALGDARAAGLRVVPQCEYMDVYIRRHPEYADLVASDEREPEP
jgi:predicted GNAT family acetyltransferase